jgi:hypothetical protein
MKSLADDLPPEIARQIHPDWRKNEAAYWAVRDSLLSQYQGQWVGFADGAAIASGTSPVAVFHAAEASGRHPFVTCVGREDEPCRMRRASFPGRRTLSCWPAGCCCARSTGWRRASAWLRRWWARSTTWTLFCVEHGSPHLQRLFVGYYLWQASLLAFALGAVASRRRASGDENQEAHDHRRLPQADAVCFGAVVAGGPGSRARSFGCDTRVSR